MQGGEVTEEGTSILIENNGTFNLSGGIITSGNIAINNNGTFNGTGGSIHASKTAIKDGIINQKGSELNSEEGPTIDTDNVDITSGTITSTNGIGVKVSGTATMTGGTINGATIGIYCNILNMSNGTINSDGIGVQTHGNKSSVTHELGIVNLSGGTINGKDNGIITDVINMTDGTVNSSEGIGATILEDGVITDGIIKGDLYGVLNKSSLTIGTDDKNIVNTKPILMGGSYGLYIEENKETNFYDGILKGTIDGYTGLITNTPLGSIMVDGEETIDDMLYQTDSLVTYQNWISVDDTLYNSIDDACAAINEGGTSRIIKVIKDVDDISFIQHFSSDTTDNITFDLNGHIVRTVQPMRNTKDTNVIVIDSSEEKTGTLNPIRNSSIENELGATITINGGNFTSSVTDVLDNTGKMIINNGTFNVDNSAITNHGELIINDINIERSKIAINQEKNDTRTTGSTTLNGGTINSSEVGIRLSYMWDESYNVIVTGGEIISDKHGIYGATGSVKIDNGKILAKGGYGIYSSTFGRVEVNGGTITSLTDIGVFTVDGFHMTGGTISAKKNGVENDILITATGSTYVDMLIEDGYINSTEQNGLYNKGAKLTITGGKIEGYENGIYDKGKIILGENDAEVGTSTPELLGHTEYGLLTTNHAEFYDGILTGIKEGYSGLIHKIPVSYVISEKSTFINRVEYTSRILEEKDGWLQVDDDTTKTYNSLDKAYEAIQGTSGTIKVIADAYIDFEQEIPDGKKVYFDLNSHSIIMTQPLKISGNVDIINSGDTGGISNLADTAIVNSGTLNITAGTFNSDVKNSLSNIGNCTIINGKFTSTISNSNTLNIKDIELITDNVSITNGGTLIVDGGNITGNIGIRNSENVVFNGGKITSESTSIESGKNITINGGELLSNNGSCILTPKSNLTVNGGRILSTAKHGILTYYSGTININGGEINGYLSGIDSTNELTVNNGTIISRSSNGIDNRGIGTILGGNITGRLYGIYTTGELTLGDNDSTINIDSPIIQGDLIGLYIGNGNTYFYDGILKGKTARCNDNSLITKLADNSSIFETTDDDYLVEFLIKEEVVVRNINKNIDYSNINTAILEANNDDKLVLLRNAPVYYEINNTNNNIVKLNMNGYSISTNKKITNSGNLYIYNTNDNEYYNSDSTLSNIRTSSNDLFINTNLLNIDNVTITNNNSSTYVIDNRNKLVLNKVVLNSIKGIYNNKEANITNSTFNCSKIGIENHNKLTIDKGSYSGTDYSIYSDSNYEVSISNASINNNIYNRGNNNVTVNDCNIYDHVTNITSKITINRTNFNNSIINNSGDMTINNSNYVGTLGNRYSPKSTTVFDNSNKLTINNTLIKINENSTLGHVLAFNNTGMLNLKENTTIYIGKNTETSFNIMGINTASSGNTLIENAKLYILGGHTCHGIYSDSDNAKTTITDGRIDIRNSKYSYGVYINYGTFEMGTFDGSGLESADVSVTNPYIYSQASIYGVGIKKINGLFNFYDGIIQASKYSKPETTSNVEYKYEATTYVDENNGYETTILEWMGNDYQEGTVVRVKGKQKFYTSVQGAINAIEPGEELILLKSVEENEITIPSGKEIIIDLDKHSIKGSITNNGLFNVYNGTLNNFDSTTLINNGTLIIGEDDEIVSSNSIKIVSEATTIINNGTMSMYDGYIEGKQAIEGIINTIPEMSRIYTTKDNQSEKKYLQSLSEESILSGETDLIITIDPNGGYYDNLNRIQEIYKKHNEKYKIYSISEPEGPRRSGCIFDGWEISDESAYNSETNEITMNMKDITIKAKWKVSPNAVARIGDNYYDSLADAISQAKKNDTIVLLKDTTEDITNNKNVTIDLNKFTVTGAFINRAELRLLNGTITNPDGIGLINTNILILGENDGEVFRGDDDPNDNYSVKIIGSNIGLKQDGRFELYDGFIEGEVALDGVIDKIPAGYYSYNETYNDHQKMYLIGTPDNAVAETRVGQKQFFFSLQDAIRTSQLTGYEIYLRKSIEAPYAITTTSGKPIIINLEGNNLSTGNVITVNNELTIHDSEVNRGTLTTTNQIVNNSKLNINNVNITQNKSNSDVITNNGELNISDSTITATRYAVYNNGSITLNENSILKTTGNYSLYNNSDSLIINNGEIHGIENAGNLIIEDGANIDNTGKNNAIYVTKADSSVQINGGTIKATNTAIATNANNLDIKMNNANYDVKVLINSSNIVNAEIKDITFTSNSSTIISLTNRNSKAEVKNCKFNTSSSVASLYGESLIENSDFVSTSSYVTLTVYDNVVINNSNITGANSINISGASNASSMVGVTINDSTVTSTGKSGYGVKLGTYSKLVLNNSKINANNYGIEVYRNNVLELNSGVVEANNYGIYVEGPTNNISIGNEDNDYSEDKMHVIAELYGIFEKANLTNTYNFYNGSIAGKTAAHNISHNSIRKGYDDVYGVLNRVGSSAVTYTTSTYSSTPEKDTPKAEDGYAKITYLGEDTNCTSNPVTNIPYSGEEEVFTASCLGTYRLEVWGAQGATSGGRGGYGAYSSGEINLAKNEKLYVNVGGQGIEMTGGYNGGGNGSKSSKTGSAYKNGGGGGGATSISTTSGLLSTHENDKDSVIIVAGGGGGGAYISGNYAGGSGGGYIAGIGLGYSNNNIEGASQDSGYKFGQGQDGLPGANYSYGESGRGGGGGGWYGGRASQITVRGVAGGSGGSGHLNNDRLQNAYMYGFEVYATEYNYNYLVGKENYLKVGSEEFNSFYDAVNAIDGDSGTIVLTKDILYKEALTLDTDKKITFDLNGHKITTTSTIINNSDLTIDDLTIDKTGTIETDMKVFSNTNKLSLKNIKINTTNDIIENTNDGSIINIDNCDITGVKFITSNNNSTININNSTINVTSGIYLENIKNIVYNISIINSNITTKNRLVSLTYGSYPPRTNTNLLIDGGRYISTSGSVLYVEEAYSSSTDTPTTTVVKNAYFEGKGEVIRLTTMPDKKVLENLEVKNNSTNSNDYSIYINRNNANNASDELKNIKITSEIANGIYASKVNIDNADIKIGGKYAIYNTGASTVINSNLSSTLYGLYASGTMTVNNSNIESQDAAVYANNNISINNSKIVGTNYGVYRRNSGNSVYIDQTTDDNSNIETFIKGGNAGLYLENDTAVYLGNNDDELSTAIPSITGGEYGIYFGKGYGKISFYNGRILGTELATNGSFVDYRTNKTIYKTQVIDTEDPSIIYDANWLSDVSDFLQVGDNTYNKFSDALANITTEGTIKVINDADVIEQVTLPTGKNITLDLNGHKISFSKSITQNSELTVTDNSEDKNGELNNYLTNVFEVKNNITLKNVTINSNNRVINTSTSSIIEIKDSKLKCAKAIQYDYYYSTANIKVESTNIESTGDAIYANARTGNLQLNNCNIKSTGYTVSSNIDTTINGGTYESENTSINSTKSLTINDGVFKGKNTVMNVTNNLAFNKGYVENTNDAQNAYYHAISCGSNSNGTSVVIEKDVEIKTIGQNGIYINGNATINNPKITIDGGSGSGITFTSSQFNAIINGARITTYGASNFGITSGYASSTVTRNVDINDITINSENIGININYPYINMNLKSGNIYGGTYGAYLSKNANNTNSILNIGDISNENVSDNNPIINGGTYGLYNDNGVVNYNSGKIRGKTAAYNDAITTIRPEYEIAEFTEADDDASNPDWNSIILSATTEYVENMNTHVKYLDLKEAIDEANSNDVLKILENKTILSQISIPLGLDITIDLDGHDISLSNYITNNGTLTISNPEGKDSTITSKSNEYFAENEGTLTINRVNLNAKKGINNKVGSTLVIDSSTSESSDVFINNSGSSTINNSNITSGTTTINNTDSLIINSSTIEGTTYAIYDSSTKDLKIDNSMLKTKEFLEDKFSLHRQNAGKTILTSTSTYGAIRFSNSNNVSTITGGTINSFIRNNGELTLDTINYEIDSDLRSTYVYPILNSKNLTIKNSNFDVKYETGRPFTLIENSNSDSTFNSQNNNYNMNLNVNNTSYLFDSSTNNIVNISNDIITGTSTNGGLTGLSFSSNTEANIDNVEINLEGPTNCIGISGSKSTVTVSGGKIKLESHSDSSTTLKGIYINSDSTFDIDGTAIEVLDITKAQDTYGIHIASGSATYKSGTIKSHSEGNAYGILMNNTEGNAITLGTYDGSGTDHADVSTTDPYIEAIGTKSGIGITTNKHTFNYYDGKILGSTSARLENELLTLSEPYYVANSYTDENNYNYCILEYNRG